MKKYLKLIPALCLSFCDVANAAIDTGEVLYAERPGALWNTSESPVFRFRSGMEAKAEYIVTDYWGRLLRLDTLHRKQVFDLHHCRAVITV